MFANDGIHRQTMIDYVNVRGRTCWTQWESFPRLIDHRLLQLLALRHDRKCLQNTWRYQPRIGPLLCDRKRKILIMKSGCAARTCQMFWKVTSLKRAADMTLHSSFIGEACRVFKEPSEIIASIGSWGRRYLKFEIIYSWFVVHGWNMVHSNTAFLLTRFAKHI